MPAKTSESRRPAKRASTGTPRKRTANKKRPASGAPLRRTQEERRAATSLSIIEGTIEAIVDKGYAGLRTRDITDRANVTWGAVQHIFGDKSELLLQVVKHAAESLLVDLSATVASGASLEKRLNTVVDLTWRLYSSPRYFAMIEIVRGTLSEPALHKRIAKAQHQVRHSITGIWTEVFSDAPVSTDQVVAVCDLVTISLSGLASRRSYLWPELPSDVGLGVIKEIALTYLQNPLKSIPR